MVKGHLKHVLFTAALVCLFSLAVNCSGENNPSFDLGSKWAGADLAKWQIGFKPVPARVDNGSLIIDYPEDDGYLISPPLFLNSNVYSHLLIKMRTSRSFQKARVFWIGPYNKNFERQFSLPIAIGGNWGYHTYVIDMSSHGGWSGIIGRLMISPVNGGGRVEIQSIEFTQYSPLLKLRAQLQEFFALEANPIPPNLGMVFVIVGPIFAGRPIDLYVYRSAVYLFFGLFLFLLGRAVYLPARIKMMQDLKLQLRRIFLFAAFGVVVFVLACWLLIEVQYSFNDLKMLVADYQAMWGKTIDEKRDVITGGDFYDFLEFCDKTLPRGAGVDFAFSDNLYYAFPEWLPIKARYYLFPRVNDSASPYKLVFGPGAEAKLNITKRYQLIAKFKDGEIILKEVE